jgi:hypothetical protein
MGYIIKNTTALLSIKLTDAARKKISEGSFNISYFQVGDSEVCYDCISGADLTTGMILKSEFNAQNLTSLPEKNKAHIKYPLFLSTDSTNTYGIPVNFPTIDEIYNTASPRGFFTGDTNSYSAFTSSAYTINPNFVVDVNSLQSGNTLTITANTIDLSVSGQVTSGDFMTIFYGDNGSVSPISNNSPILTYKVINITGNTSGNTGSITIEVDRNLPDFSIYSGNGRVLFYPKNMTIVYDTFTPNDLWVNDIISFDTNCDISERDVKIWNMNSPWTESPAGLFTNQVQGFTEFGSSGYCGTKEYLGYNSDNGQIDSGGTYYFNSFSERINVLPSNQKTIGIVHFTNNSVDNLYGEKFALKPFDPLFSGDTGQARNFSITIPWLMWHKSTTNTIGETFFVDPAGYESLNLFQIYHMESEVNSDMNNPGLRYYHLWDTNTNTNGFPNRVGKVWPDYQMITFDDEEIVAVLNSKSNRNWTLPAPKLGLMIPNTCGDLEVGTEGLLSGSNETLWVTYRFNNTGLTNSLHSNYYSKIVGSNSPEFSSGANVMVRFGNEFPFLNDGTSSSPSGFSANDISILVQKVSGDTKPDPTSWLEINVTSQITGSTYTGVISSSELTSSTIQITKELYTGATQYNLSNYLELPQQNATGVTHNFGDDYYFYGNIKTDIQATIYVMDYKCNLGQNQFLTSSNPTWNNTFTPYITEVGLYDSNKDLMIMAKVQSPEKRQGLQQYSIKFDF